MIVVLLPLLTLSDIVFSSPIVYGDKLKKIEYPFLVHLKSTAREIDSETNKVFVYSKICGGSIISTRSILTAAHCLEFSIGEPTVYVFAGVLRTVNFGKKGQKLRMSTFDIHPEYKSKNIDIAFVHLKNPLRLVPQKVKLATLATAEYGALVKIAGWGYMEFNKRSDILRETSMKVIGKDKCEPTSGSKNDFICIIDTLQKSTFCSGDSGGPVIFENSVIGVISENFSESIEVDGKTIRVCSAKHPSLAVDTSLYIDWIDANKK